MNRATTLTVALLVAVAAPLAWQVRSAILALGGDVNVPRPEAPAAGPPSTAAIPQPVELPGLGAFSEIADRPLFAATRRPPPAAAPHPPAPAPSPPPRPNVETGGYTLSGVIIDDERKIALLQPAGRRGETQRVTEGDRLGPWRVQSISAREVVLEQRGVLDRVNLRENVLSAAEKSRLAQANKTSRPARAAAPEAPRTQPPPRIRRPAATPARPTAGTGRTPSSRSSATATRRSPGNVAVRPPLVRPQLPPRPR